MPPTLEERRLAIVAALREVMAESPASPVGRAATDQHEVDPAPVANTAEHEQEEMHLLRADDALEWERELADDDVTDWDTPSVPPLEPGGSLSRAASLALFGHA